MTEFVAWAKMAFQSKHEYSPVEVDETFKATQGTEKRSSQRNFMFILVVAATAILSSMVTSLVTMHYYGPTISQFSSSPEIQTSTQSPMAVTPKYSCGNSSTEALALGCVFDPLSVNWIHTECSHYGIEEFKEITDPRPNMKFPFWRDKAGTTRIPDEHALSLSDEFHTTQAWHLSHCAYIILRLHDGYLRGARIDSNTNEFIHTQHCLEMFVELILKDEEKDVINTTGNVGFMTC
ncbi:uncharacterized protein LY89DRAFT_787439 [Mollisia scopiformis]|uniref:Uncharacterized protein n=1 Tax=Mollisia scopiformis TaxID=149040 RepID=A0A132BD97_MOLSC|nr:uncharacterized protein LY89DRAFT_787439 [Mollisia scopiformis]KUJ10402.1 hypothetical protein LY89DRAFT_787439 [Mollisia scopiformis]